MTAPSWITSMYPDHLTLEQRIEVLRIASSATDERVLEYALALLDMHEDDEPVPHIKVEPSVEDPWQQMGPNRFKEYLNKAYSVPAASVEARADDSHAAEMAAVHDALGMEEVMREAVHALLQDGEAWLYVREDVDRLRAAVVSRDQVFHAAAPLTPFGEAQRKARQQANAARQDKAYAACVAQFNATREPT